MVRSHPDKKSPPSPVELFAAKLAKQNVERSIADLLTVERLIATLTRQEQEIVRLRIGLGPSLALTLAETANIVGVSPSRIGQIEDKAFRRIKWVCNNIDIHDLSALDALIARRRDEAAEAEQIKKRDALQLALDQEQKRSAKRDREDVRRAKARNSAWKRKLHEAETARDRLKADALFVTERISELERRGRLLRAIMPHERQMAELRAAAETFAAAIAKAEATVMKIRSTPPEGPQFDHASTTAQGR